MGLFMFMGIYCNKKYVFMHITRLYFWIGSSMRKMYCTDLGTSKLRCANADGSDVEDLITTGLDRPAGIALCRF
jgi:hypothetical protein